MQRFNSSIFAFTLFLFGLPVFAESQSPSSCYQPFPEWDLAIEAEALLTKSDAVDSEVKQNLLERFADLQQHHDSFYNGTAAICAEIAAYDDKLKSYNVDLADYETQFSAHATEVANFNAQCSVVHTIEEQQSCQSWADQINNNKTILDDWAGRIGSRKTQLDSEALSLNTRGDKINSDWKTGISKFIALANAAIPKVIHKEVDRMAAILADSPAIFVVEDSNARANPAPRHYIEYFEQVTQNADRIGEAAARHDVDPDLIRAIIWMESTHGYYDSATGLVLQPKSILPMNVYTNYWTGFKITHEGLKDPAINIDTGTKILARIQARTSVKSIAKIATLYGSLAADKETEYGKTVEHYYYNKPWLESKE
jgi:hypothetical protein